MPSTEFESAQKSVRGIPGQPESLFGDGEREMGNGYDGHGSVRNLTNTSGAVTDTYDYDAFGILIASTGSTPNNYLFAGEQFDPALGLYYNRARYLDVRAGRFWGMDEDEGNGFEPPSLHKYLYVQADPINHLDRSGQKVEEQTLAAGAEESIGADEDEQAISIFQTIFRTTLRAGQQIIYSTPTLLLRAAAALTALAVAASSIIDAISGPPGELPDAAAAQNQQRSIESPLTLFRDTSGTSPSDFKWRGPIIEPDGLSFFEQPFQNPQPKQFSIGFKTKYFGVHNQGQWVDSLSPS